MLDLCKFDTSSSTGPLRHFYKDQLSTGQKLEHIQEFVQVLFQVEAKVTEMVEAVAKEASGSYELLSCT